LFSLLILVFSIFTLVVAQKLSGRFQQASF
jgi:hypothetical protein